MSQEAPQDLEDAPEVEDTEEYHDPEFNEDDSSEAPPIDIVAYNELRSCADLARMTNDGIIDLQPDFQRDVVWKTTDQTRFIDSLIKQLPIPSMCFALDHKTDHWIVIDGLQRMTAIVKFLAGGDWRLSKLDDIDERLSGKLAASFKNAASGDNRKLFDRVQNKTIPIPAPQERPAGQARPRIHRPQESDLCSRLLLASASRLP